MAEVKFTYEGLDIIIRCNKNQKMRDICTYLSTKINVNINSLIFLYGGTQLNLEKTFKELTKENKISILVDKYKNEEICPKCGKILNNEIINEIISSNNKVNYSLVGIKRQIELIMTDINNNVDINYIISQLQNINVVINKINEDKSADFKEEHFKNIQQVLVNNLLKINLTLILPLSLLIYL